MTQIMMQNLEKVAEQERSLRSSLRVRVRLRCELQLMTPGGLKKAATERTCGNPTDEAMLQAFSATELTSATSPQGSTDEPDLAWIRLEGRTFLHNPSMLIRRHVVLRALPVRITIADTFGVVRVKPLRLHIEPGQMVEFRQAYLPARRARRGEAHTCEAGVCRAPTQASSNLASRRRGCRRSSSATRRRSSEPHAQASRCRPCSCGGDERWHGITATPLRNAR